jgi:hypothetical protein
LLPVTNTPPWPSSSAAARSRPEPLRLAEKHRHIFLHLLAKGIEPRRAEVAAIVAVFPQVLTAAAAKFVAADTSPAKLTTPECPW